MLILMYSTHFGAYGGCDVKYPSCVNESIGRSQNSQKIHFSNYFYKIFQNCILLDSFLVEVRNFSFILSVIATMRHLWNYQMAPSAVPAIKMSAVDWIGAFTVKRDKRTISGCLWNISGDFLHRNVIFPRNSFFHTEKIPKSCFENGVDWSDFFFGENDRI